VAEAQGRAGLRRADVGREPGQEAASTTPLTEEGVRQALEPGFISAAYFMRFSSTRVITPWPTATSSKGAMC
jgi:hypothetical protein